jgi:hypothetical protein
MICSARRSARRGGMLIACPGAARVARALAQKPRAIRAWASAHPHPPVPVANAVIIVEWNDRHCFGRHERTACWRAQVDRSPALQPSVRH